MAAPRDPSEASPQQLLLSPRRLRSHKLLRLRDRSIVGTLGAAAGFSVLVTAAIVFVLGVETVHFFRQDEVSVGEFLGSTTWSPLLGSEKHFGIWPLVCGTALVAGVVRGAS